MADTLKAITKGRNKTWQAHYAKKAGRAGRKDNNLERILIAKENAAEYSHSYKPASPNLTPAWRITQENKIRDLRVAAQPGELSSPLPSPPPKAEPTLNEKAEALARAWGLVK